MNKDKASEATPIRHKAEEQLKNRSSKTGSILSEIETLKLIQELELHQIELEMQNMELSLAVKLKSELLIKY
jgi:hypothetical protein